MPKGLVLGAGVMPIDNPGVRVLAGPMGSFLIADAGAGLSSLPPKLKRSLRAQGSFLSRTFSGTLGASGFFSAAWKSDQSESVEVGAGWKKAGVEVGGC